MGFNRYRAGPGRVGFTANAGWARVGLGYPGPWARRVAAVRFRLPQRGKGHAAGPPPPPFPHDVRRSRCATSSSPSPSYPPRHPLPRRSTARPSRISRPPPPWPPPGVASGGDPCWGCAGAIPTTFLAPHTLYFIP